MAARLAAAHLSVGTCLECSRFLPPEGAKVLQMQKIVRALKAAFPCTIPVLVGYLFIGVAFGMLFEEKGYAFFWALLMSVTVYAGSLQFIAVNFFTPGVSLVNVALMALMVNVRHVFYGLSMLDKFQGMGAKKPYMIFSLTDETYSLLCAIKTPEGVDRNWFFFLIALLNQCYWVAGSVIGAVAGALLSFDSTGIDFAMTALFTVIFTEQWLTSKNHLPALVGVAATAACRVLFGTEAFLLPAMLTILAGMLFFRRPIENGFEKEGEA